MPASTFRWREWRRAALLTRFDCLVPAAIAHLAVRCNMPRATANIGRVCLGVLLVFAAWVVGGFLGSMVLPDSVLVGRRETLAGKVGCSVTILATALIIRRYILRSFGLALVCLAVTEIIALFVVMSFSGLTTHALLLTEKLQRARLRVSGCPRRGEERRAESKKEGRRIYRAPTHRAAPSAARRGGLRPYGAWAPLPNTCCSAS